MKKIVWLASAIGLTVGSANAQSGTISIVAEDGRNVFVVAKSKPETKTMNDAELNQAIDGLVANSKNNRPLTNIAPSSNEHLEESINAGYDEGYRETQLAFNQLNQSSSLMTTLNSDAPRIAARAAARAAHGRSLGRCALYVRKALQSAGYKFTPQPSAYMYATKGILSGAGFTKISNHNYVPQVGDVAVFNRSGKHPHGHIQIYDGNQWVSDFRQNKFSPYTTHNGYTLWRDARNVDASNLTNTQYAFNGE